MTTPAAASAASAAAPATPASKSATVLQSLSKGKGKGPAAATNPSLATITPADVEKFAKDILADKDLAKSIAAYAQELGGSAARDYIAIRRRIAASARPEALVRFLVACYVVGPRRTNKQFNNAEMTAACMSLNGILGRDAHLAMGAYPEIMDVIIKTLGEQSGFWSFGASSYYEGIETLQEGDFVAGVLAVKHVVNSCKSDREITLTKETIAELMKKGDISVKRTAVGWSSDADYFQGRMLTIASTKGGREMSTKDEALLVAFNVPPMTIAAVKAALLANKA